MITLETLETPKNLLSVEAFRNYQSFLYPFNIKILYDSLKIRLEKDPDYEVWVPLVYHRLVSHLKSLNAITEYNPHKVYVSNRGRVLSFRRTKPKYLSTCLDSGYPRLSLDIGSEKRRPIILHRALACCFIPIPKELGPTHPKKLHVNHINGVTNDLSLSNLEWTTPNGNFTHALRTGLLIPPKGKENKLVKPIKGKVIKGNLTGYEFLIFGSLEIVSLGLDKGNISSCCLGKRKSHQGCEWSFATEEEIINLSGNEIKLK